MSIIRNNNFCTNKENIPYLCYELYKNDWEQTHIKDKKSFIIDYFNGLIDSVSSNEFTFNDYIEEFGYNGEIYSCFEEFKDNEFLDEDYIRSLLDDNNYGVYLDYIKDIDLER